jgi:hypothetical protein
MNFCRLPLSPLPIRMCLIMGMVVITGFTGYWLMGILSWPVFFSALLGIQFNKKISIRKTQRSGQVDAHHYWKPFTAQA